MVRKAGKSICPQKWKDQKKLTAEILPNIAAMGPIFDIETKKKKHARRFQSLPWEAPTIT